MLQVIVTFALLCCVPFVSHGKIKIWMSILVVGVLLGLLAGVWPLEQAQIFVGLFIHWDTLEIILVVSLISTLGGLMKRGGLLDRIVSEMHNSVRNIRASMMFIPAIMGVLVVPGGAMLSMPFLDTLGEQANLPKVRRLVINLAFRHTAVFLLPYSSSLLLVVSILTDLNVYDLIKLNAIFALGMVVLGYFFFVRKVPKNLMPYDETVSRFGEFGRLMWHLLPVYLCVVLNTVLGWSFVVGLLLSMLLVFVMTEKKGFLRRTAKSFNYNLTLVFVAITFLKEIITRMDGLMDTVTRFVGLAQSPVIAVACMALCALFFGFLSGSQPLGMGVVIPFVPALGLSLNGTLLAAFVIYIAGFSGYYFSLLHMCQVLCLEYMGVNTKEIYRDYGWFMPAIGALVLVCAGVGALILL